MLKISDYLTVKAASEFLGVTGRTLRKWEALGKIKVIRNPMSNYRLYRKEDLEALLNEIAKLKD